MGPVLPSPSWPVGHSGARRIITCNLRTQSPYRLSIDRYDLIFTSQLLSSQRGSPGGCASISNSPSRPFPRCARLLRSARHLSAIPSQATAPALPSPGQSYPLIPSLATPHGRDPTQRSHRCFHFPFAGLRLTPLLCPSFGIFIWLSRSLPDSLPLLFRSTYHVDLSNALVFSPRIIRRRERGILISSLAFILSHRTEPACDMLTIVALVTPRHLTAQIEQ